MHNFKEDILKAAKGEPIQAVVIGERFKTFRREVHELPEDPTDDLTYFPNSVMPWWEAEEILDYSYDDDYGAPDCHAITAWTPSRVLFICTYDGSTWVASVPRNPTDHSPILHGGG